MTEILKKVTTTLQDLVRVAVAFRRSGTYPVEAMVWKEDQEHKPVTVWGDLPLHLRFIGFSGWQGDLAGEVIASLSWSRME